MMVEMEKLAAVEVKAPDSDSDDKPCYDSSGRRMVDKGAGRSSGVTPTALDPKEWERCLKTKAGQELLQASLEVGRRGLSSSSRPSPRGDASGQRFLDRSRSSRRGDALGKRNRDRLRDIGAIETKQEHESDNDSVYCMQAPKTKALPQRQNKRRMKVKAEHNEPPKKYVQRVQAVKAEKSDSDEAAAPSAAPAARPSCAVKADNSDSHASAGPSAAPKARPSRAWFS